MHVFSSNTNEVAHFPHDKKDAMTVNSSSCLKRR
jgi:hypothetical protein